MIIGDNDDDEQQNIHTQQAAQLAAIETEVKKQDLTSSLFPIQRLVDYYKNLPDATPGFLQGASYLGSTRCNYTHFRRVRGDGNCYYRALLYSICEVCLKKQVHKEQFSALKDFITASLKHVCQFGYDENALDMFHEELVDVFDFISTFSDGTDKLVEEKLKEMHTRLNEENGSSDYCTWFLRVITAAHLKSDADRFMLFLDASDDTVNHCLDIATFCAREVEPMGKECGMVQVTALAEALQVRVNVEYLDGRDLPDNTKKLMRYEFGPEGALEVTLLYRPGHYDILYRC